MPVSFGKTTASIHTGGGIIAAEAGAELRIQALLKSRVIKQQAVAILTVQEIKLLKQNLQMQ